MFVQDMSDEKVRKFAEQMEASSFRYAQMLGMLGEPDTRDILRERFGKQTSVQGTSRPRNQHDRLKAKRRLRWVVQTLINLTARGLTIEDLIDWEEYEPSPCDWPMDEGKAHSSIQEHGGVIVIDGEFYGADEGNAHE